MATGCHGSVTLVRLPNVLLTLTGITKAVKYLLPACLFALLSTPAAACEMVRLGAIEITNAWSRASMGTSRPAVLYLTIRNSGTSEDGLVAVATPVASKSMLHDLVVQGGVASMPHVNEIAVPAGASIALEPGGYHGMLMGLTQALKVGETFQVTLTFREAGQVTVPVVINAIGAKTSGCLDSNR